MTEQPKKQGAVLRNTLVMVGSQLAGVPLSIVLSAASARYLGATDFGYLYLAGTMAGFGFLVVEWGHGNAIAADVARDNARAGELLGTSLTWRVVATLVVSLVLFVLSKVLGYERTFFVVLALVVVTNVFATLRSACQDVCRGFERLDIGAYTQLGGQLLQVALVIPALVLGGKLLGLLFAQIVAAMVVAVIAWVGMRSITRQKARFDPASFKHLFTHGSSFLLFGVVMALQPNIDAIFLSKLTSPAVLGWQAAAQRLTGFVTMPAIALVGALFPTLSRLYAHDQDEYRHTAARALEGTSLLAIPAALGCALYRGIGAQVYGDGSFAPVEQNLLALSVLVFLLYFSMPLGTAILAAGRQRPFSFVQCLCIVVSVALDPILIPWFQARYQNGGLGVCAAGIISEVVVLAAATPLIPKGILTFALAKSLGKGVVAGVAMAAVALGLEHVHLTPYVAAPLSLAAYVGCLWVVGGIDREHVEAVRAAVLRKMGSRRAA